VTTALDVDQWQYGPIGAPELSYSRPWNPQVCSVSVWAAAALALGGAAEAGTAAMVASASANATVYLVMFVSSS
jgi:hypothetical protein